MTVIYLAGPMTGHPEYNFPAFREAALDLRVEGISVFSPVETDEDLDGFDGTTPCPHTHEFYMKRDLPHLLGCDEVRVLPGWFDSKGAVSECLVARLAGIPIREYPTGHTVQHSLGLLAMRLVNLIAGTDIYHPSETGIGSNLRPPECDPSDGSYHAYAEDCPCRGPRTFSSAPPLFVAPGVPAVPTTWEEGLDAVLHEMRAIMVERQDKYGPENITQQGLLGVLTRAQDDKIERIKGALNGSVVRGRVVLDPIEDGSQTDDTFDDGCIDAANYIGPIMLMLKRGWWSLPREEK